MAVEIPKTLILELKNPKRKRTVKTILRENWTLLEDVDNALKTYDDPKELLNLPILATFILQNFLTTISLIVSPKKVSLRKQRSKHENAEVLEFEDDLREAQRDWKAFFGKYEEVMKVVVRVAKEKGKVDFHAELWQRTRFQKIVSSITNFSEKVHSNTVHYIPPTRFIFALITFTANWTVFPVVNVSKKIAYKTLPLEKVENYPVNGNANGNGIHKALYQNGISNGNSPEPSNPRTLRKLDNFNENFTKFNSQIQNSGRLLSEKEREWQEKTTQFQKEVRARLEVQEKRLIDEIEMFEEEKEKRRQQEEVEFQKRLERQNEDFENLIGRIEQERKALEDEELENLFELCENQDKSLLDLFDSNSTSSTSIHWTDHEDYWNDRLQILRNSLSTIRSDYWNFESYLKQYLAESEEGPNFVKVVYKMESAAFGRTVTRAKGIIGNEQEFFESLMDKYADDLFLRVLMKTTNKVLSQLENIILELWNLSVDPSDSDAIHHLRSAVFDLDPCSIPTTWRLKGICHSASPEDYDTPIRNASPIVNGHF